MSDSSLRTVQIEFSGAVSTNIIQSALENAVSPAITDRLDLSMGDNTIDVPVITGVVVTGLTIIPPPANATLITLKGDASDVGIPLHFTDPTSIGLDTSFTSLVLNAANNIDQVILIWT